jgi:pimeloyl-ACP methyl ester carboxylesterase
MLSTTTVDIPVAGGPMRALRFGEGPRTIVAVHGITASSMEFRTVARYLPPGWNLLAPDLRGRGGSAHLPGPYGMAVHASDICAVAEWAGAPVVLAGHSMGAYAALRAAVRRPDLFARLVLVDGGLPLPVPPGADPDAVLRATVGPAIARLAETYPSVDEYVALFRQHPALAAAWTEDADAYARYDATGEPGAVRSRVSADAVAADGRDLLVDADSFGEDIRALTIPALLLHAPRGMLGREPGLLPVPVIDAWTTGTPLTGELVPDCNHYTIVLAPHAAEMVARRLTV